MFNRLIELLTINSRARIIIQEQQKLKDESYDRILNEISSYNFKKLFTDVYFNREVLHLSIEKYTT